MPVQKLYTIYDWHSGINSMKVVCLVAHEKKNKQLLSFSKNLYPKEALIKASYSFIDRCYVYLSQSETDYSVEITAKESYLPDSLTDEFMNEMLSQTVRFQVYKQTHVIRELLMARAMASTMIDELPERDCIDTDTNLDDIVVDWFEKHEQE